MKLDPQTLTKQAAHAKEELSRYRVILFVITFFLCYGFLITRITAYTQKEPAPEVGEQGIKRLTVDEDAIQRIKSLEDQNVEVRTLFNEARKNPFSE